MVHDGYCGNTPVWYVIGSHPIRNESMDTEPPSTPSTGKETGSPSRRRAVTYSRGR